MHGRSYRNARFGLPIGPSSILHDHITEPLGFTLITSVVFELYLSVIGVTSAPLE